MQNTSGQGPASIVPPELDRWNWGAMCLNWIWGLGNKTYIALLMFVPLVNIVMPFVLGAKGNAWAWRNKRWESVEQFQETQRKWTKWGFVFLACLVPAVVAMFFGVSYGLKESDAYQGAAAKLASSEAVVNITGSPLATGLPQGSINISGPSGRADLQFSVSGPKGAGTAYVEAKRELGVWSYPRIVFEDSATRARIEVR